MAHRILSVLCAAATILFFIAKISVASATETIVSVPVRSSLRVKKKKSKKQKQSSGDQQSLSSIHSRYAKVLQVIDDNRCSMANAFRLAGCPRSTVRDFVSIAELKIVDHREHE